MDPFQFASVGLVTIAYWIGATAFGAIVSGFNLISAWRDRGYLTRRQVVDGRALIAKVSLLDEIGRLLVFVGLCVAGVLVAANQFTADPPGVSLIVRGVILSAITILVSQSVMQLWLRRKLRQPVIRNQL